MTAPRKPWLRSSLAPRRASKTQSSTKRFSREDVLRGLQAIIAGATGTRLQLTCDMKFADYLQEHGDEWGWIGFDSLDFVFRVEAFFGVGIPRASLCGARDEKLLNLTFGMIADFIAERAPYVEIEPIALLGKPCAPVGAFRAIQSVAGLHARNCSNFGPSTPIRDRLRGMQLRFTWDYLRWLSHERLPAMQGWIGNSTWLGYIGVTLCLLWMGASVFVASVAGALSGALFGIGLSVLCGFGMVKINRILAKPPEGFQTFRDVAVAMVDGGAAK